MTQEETKRLTETWSDVEQPPPSAPSAPQAPMYGHVPPQQQQAPAYGHVPPQQQAPAYGHVPPQQQQAPAYGHVPPQQQAPAYAPPPAPAPAYVLQQTNINNNNNIRGSVPLGTDEEQWMMCALTFFCNCIGCVAAFAILNTLKARLGATNGSLLLAVAGLPVSVYLTIQCGTGPKKYEEGSGPGVCMYFVGACFVCMAVIAAAACIRQRTQWRIYASECNQQSTTGIPGHPLPMLM